MALGFYSDLTPDIMLTILFALAVRYFPKSDFASTNAVRVSPGAHSSVENSYPSPIPKYLCLVVMCFNGIVAPSYACSVYYGSFLAIMAAMALDVLTDKMVGRLFKTICFYTCVHVLVLFAYQIEWVRIVRYIGIDLRLAK